MAESAHEYSKVHCTHCRRLVELECEGLPAYVGYETYNEYFCPYCRKQNHQKSSGAIVSARIAI